jgi:putative peptide zinc metalloprotease protein
MTEPERYRLGGGTEVVRRRGSLLLVARGSGRTVRVSPVAADLLPLLQSGAPFDELSGRLRALHPSAGVVEPKLRAFLRTLGSAGLLHGQEEARRARGRRYPLFAADACARVIARPLRALLPGRVAPALAGAMAMASLALVAQLCVEGRLPGLRELAEHLHWAGLSLFAFVVVPVHELAHAVACRLGGIPAGQFGIVLHGGIVPGPYVDTSRSYLLADRWRRFAIPAAGPFVNLLAAGIVAAVLLYAAPPADCVPALDTLLFACLLFVYFDTTPLTASDGSHCIEALLEDELARRHALLPRSRLPTTADARAALRYRACAAAHLVLSLALFYLWAS